MNKAHKYCTCLFFTLKTTKLMFCLFILFCILKILLNLKKFVVYFKNRNHFVLSSNLLLFEYTCIYNFVDIKFCFDMKCSKVIGYIRSTLANDIGQGGKTNVSYRNIGLTLGQCYLPIANYSSYMRI